jgi:hypothetical protein
VLAFGCNPEFDSDGLATTVQDPLVIRFSSQESFTDWQTRADNTAGELRISSGSEIVSAVQTKQQVIVFTNMSVNAMQFIGPRTHLVLTKYLQIYLSLGRMQRLLWVTLFTGWAMGSSMSTTVTSDKFLAR